MIRNFSRKSESNEAQKYNKIAWILRLPLIKRDVVIFKIV